MIKSLKFLEQGLDNFLLSFRRNVWSAWKAVPLLDKWIKSNQFSTLVLFFLLHNRLPFVYVLLLNINVSIYSVASKSDDSDTILFINSFHITGW